MLYIIKWYLYNKISSYKIQVFYKDILNICRKYKNLYVGVDQLVSYIIKL